MIKTIYNLEPTYRVYPDVGICKIWLTFQGKTYCGTAQLSPADKDFFSEKVGLNIALSRARIKLLKDMTKQAKYIFIIKKQMWLEATEYGKLSLNEVDPKYVFLHKVGKADSNYNNLLHALRKEKAYLNKYLQEQDKMVERVKIHRSKDKKE